MIREESPNGAAILEFDGQGEVGMGGPVLGTLLVNGVAVLADRLAINRWIWSEDSRYLACVEWVGRGSDEGGDLRLYDLLHQQCLDWRHPVGWAPSFQRFHSGIIEFAGPQQAVRVPCLGGGEDEAHHIKAIMTGKAEAGLQLVKTSPLANE